MLPSWLRRIGWASAFVALAARLGRGLRDLDKPLPQEQPASWPPLAFERPEVSRPEV